MAKHCEVCKQDYPDSLASCPNCDAAKLFQTGTPSEPVAGKPTMMSGGGKETQLAPSGGKETQLAPAGGKPTQLAPPESGSFELPTEQQPQAAAELPSGPKRSGGSLLQDAAEEDISTLPDVPGEKSKKTMLAKSSQPTMLARQGPRSTVLAPEDESAPMHLPPTGDSPKGTVLARGAAQPTMLAKGAGQTQLAPAGEAMLPMPPGEEKKTMLTPQAQQTQLAPQAKSTQLAPEGGEVLGMPPGEEKKTMLGPRQGATVLAAPEDEGPMDLPEDAPAGAKKTMLPQQTGATVLAPPEDSGPLPFPDSEAKKTMLSPQKGATVLAPEQEVEAEVGSADLTDSQRSALSAEIAREMLEGDSTVDVASRPAGGIADSSTEYETADSTKAPPVKPKYGRRLVAGGFLGLIAGLAAAFALLHFEVLTPDQMRDWFGLTKYQAPPDAAKQARIHLDNGEFQKAIDAASSAENPDGVQAILGEARWCRYLVQQSQKNKEPNRKDAEVEQAVGELTKAQDRDPRAMLYLGIIEEVCKNPDGARKIFQQGKDKFKDAAFQAGLDRLDVQTGPGKEGAALPRPDADQRARLEALLLMLTAFQAPEQPAAGGDEAGYKFWEAAKLAQKSDYKGAIAALDEAVKRHKARRHLNLRKQQNPNSDPNEDIFLRAANDLKIYWQIREATGIKPDDPDPARTIKNLVDAGGKPDELMQNLLKDAAKRGLVDKDAKPNDLFDALDKVEKIQKQFADIKDKLEKAKYVNDEQKDLVKGVDDALKDASNKAIVTNIKKQLKDAGVEDEDAEKGVGLVIKERDDVNKMVADAIKQLEAEGFLPEKSTREKFADGLTRAIVATRSPLVSALVRTAGHLAYLGEDATIGGMIKSDLAGRLAASEEKSLELSLRLKSARTSLQMLAFWLPLLERREHKEVHEGAALDAKRVLDDKVADPVAKAQAKCVQGLVLRNQGKYDAAREALADALKIKKTDNEGFWRQYAAHAQRQLTDPTYFYLPQGQKLLNAGELDDALLVLNQGVGAFPADGRLLALRSIAALDLAISKADGRLKAADVDQPRKDAQAALKAGATAEGNYALGRISEELGRRDEAERAYRAAVQAHPANDREGSRYRVALGRVLLQMQPPKPVNNGGDKVPMPRQVGDATKPANDQLKLQAAIALLTTALAAADDLDVNTDVEAAIRLGDQAIAAGNPEGYLIKGIALTRKGEWTRGLQTYTEGLRRLIKPEYAEGLFFIVNNHPGFTLPDALRVPDPVQGEKHYAAGLKMYFGGQYSQAEEEFSKAYYNNPQDARYLYFLGLARLAQGKRDQAIDNFQRGWVLERQAKPGSATVGAALERVQGPARQVLNSYRQ